MSDHQYTLRTRAQRVVGDSGEGNDAFVGVVDGEDDSTFADTSLTAAAVAAATTDGAVGIPAEAPVADDVVVEGHVVDAVDDNDEDGKEFSKWHKNAFGAAVPKQSGKFSKEESELVRKSVEEFCAAKQISTARLCSECDHKAELKGAWMEIAKSIPHRSVQSVYRHGIRRLHPFKRGCWSEAECISLVEQVARIGKKWSTIQGKLNRSADSCRDKYREMSDEFIKGRWKEQETEMLKLLIREQVAVEPNTDMKEVGRIVEEKGMQLPWSNISKRMGKRSRLSCFKKWQKLIGVVPEEDEHNPGSRKRKAAASSEGDQDTGKRRVVVKLECSSSKASVASPTATGEFDDAYSAKIADETVEAVGLPDARSSFV
ncbi:hypothetical protein ACA910_009248 [Epithemia clementina (nom. ined.)]